MTYPVRQIEQMANEPESIRIQRLSYELELQKFQWQQITTVIGALLVLGWIKLK